MKTESNTHMLSIRRFVSGVAVLLLFVTLVVVTTCHIACTRRRSDEMLPSEVNADAKEAGCIVFKGTLRSLNAAVTNRLNKWQVAEISVVSVLKGHLQAKTVAVWNIPGTRSPQTPEDIKRGARLPRWSVAVGGTYIIRIRKNESLSAGCESDVYECIDLCPES